MNLHLLTQTFDRIELESQRDIDWLAKAVARRELAIAKAVMRHSPASMNRSATMPCGTYTERVWNVGGTQPYSEIGTKRGRVVDTDKFYVELIQILYGDLLRNLSLRVRTPQAQDTLERTHTNKNEHIVNTYKT